ncbi:uncharacterized protein PGTG_11722 [Puccinia graminis f. sp. tritici CRL 75-36-700-3]|uniref:CUE domain-containing protein n=1 Tax=Puccinia graminis f. sp. tritici (strain CRL 75-36-700-3 / race SCCL) TaxID=418459 RepID=E3KNU1_PUCGT|nr:uncharacterized protein PGTG_11722 [Puccinia graminis f. sp. tritici CRL 75-36-700-3]EFP85966.1 hypothetical protein PGTG_11722 [Puccinia graminis f. sp. tritici CRL 75-36-700-3]
MNSTEPTQETSPAKQQEIENAEGTGLTNNQLKEAGEQSGTKDHHPADRNVEAESEREAVIEGGAGKEQGEGLVKGKELPKMKEEEVEEAKEKEPAPDLSQQPEEPDTESLPLPEEKVRKPQENQHQQETQVPPIESQTKPNDRPSTTTEQNLAQDPNRSDHEQADQFSPQVQELLAIFPQIQPSILEDVLAAHGNVVSACISDLLAISDPTYKPSAQESLVQSDEELARQLSLQESQQQQGSQEQQQISNLPYQPRIKRNTPPNRSFVRPGPAQPVEQALADPIGGQPGLSSGGKDEIQKIAEEIGKLAETGKKTMSMWLEKAKAKMQEIQLPNQPPSQAESLEGGYEHVGRPSSSSNPVSPNPANHPNPSAPSTTKNSRITPALPHASRYANTNRTNPSTQSSARTLGGPVMSSHHGSSETPRAVVEGYQVEDSHPSSTPHDRERLAGSKADASVPALAKIPSAQSSAILPQHHQAKVRDDDEESLEYTRNPFEDDD